MKKVFNNEDVSTDVTMEVLNIFLKPLVPYVSITTGCFGNDTIMLLVSFDPKENWKHGYVENSNYFRMSIYENGKMEVFTQSLHKNGYNYENRLKVKFRKCTVKTKEEIVLKIKTFIEKVEEELKGS